MECSDCLEVNYCSQSHQKVHWNFHKKLCVAPEKKKNVDLKKIVGFTLGKWQSTIGEHGLGPASLKNMRELVSGDCFNGYFQKLFVGNEASYLRWKEVLTITKLEDLVKLRALANHYHRHTILTQNLKKEKR
ncbi:hypothetical protein TL16_g12762 [Triparma laevis f. inornata]|uniref:MYND-type domain-containing protein n=1 Tax=Triparma laevis f. inornata TaxID=1714386 RepID=A0A9W7EXG6_9STRA|nr:hypothetical protein TL16_g12762 [Triparma laevis f. inornata]